jgi:putative ABC transport system ATP-binding protein
LVDKGKTLLIVTHNEAIAKRCDRIFRIKDGYVEIEE